VLRLPPFVYEPAFSVGQAVQLLAKYGDDALPVSGGTDLYANMKQGLAAPRVLVGLRSISELHTITYDDTRGLEIGALCSLRALAEDPCVLARYPALAQAASLVGTPEIRAMGTIGGNVCLDTRCNYYNQPADWRKALGYCLKWGGDTCRVAEHSATCLAVNSSDTAPVLQALDARIHLTGPAGKRVVSVAEFYRNDGRAACAKRSGEIVTKITVPPPRPHTRSSYRKLRLRDCFDFPMLGIAVVVQLDSDRTCRGARLVLGAVAPHPVQVRSAEQRLVGSQLDRDAIADAAELAFRAGKPMDNTSGSLVYRKRMLRVFTQRALEDVASL
jgi:4-hydroxybenzoyl-CoA reductase subunit beta